MNIGPFRLSGEWSQEHVAVIRDLLQVDAPWWLHLGESSGRLELTFRSHLRHARYWRSGRITFPTSPSYLKHWLPHEVGHSADVLLLTFNQGARRAVHALMHTDTPDCGYRWSDPDASWHERPTEAFGEWWKARWFGGSDRLGTHRWTGDVSRQIEELVMGLADDPFKDIEGSVHRDAILWAAGQGLIAGYDNGRFRPNVSVTRGQLATILHAHHVAHHGGEDG